MFTNDLHSFGIGKSIADFQNFNSVQENVASSNSQNDRVAVDFPKFLNLTCEKESVTSTPDKLVKNMGQAKKKKRKRVYSPRKKRKKVTLECEGLDTDETVNWDLAALAKEATGKGEDFDSSNADLNDLPFLTVGQELEKEMKKNTLTKNLTETEVKNALNEEKLLVGTSSNFSDVWRINSNSNLNITLQKDHRVSHNNIDSNITKGQNMFPSLPAVQNNAKSVQMLSHEAPPTLTQEGQNLKGSVLKSLLMPKLKNAYKPPNPKTFSAYLPISSSISMANQRSLLKTSVKAGQKNPCVSTDAAVLVSNSKGQQYGMTFHPNSPQHLPTAYAKNNFIHFTNMSHKETDKNKIASHNRPISNFPTQMNFHQTHFPPLVDGNVKTNTTSFCNSSNKHMINEHNEYVYDMDFEIEPEKDICENLIPPTLIKEERISHEENVGNFDEEVPKINAENDSDKNPSFPVASKVSVTGHNICDSVKSSDVSSIEEVEENLPLSHYIKKFQKDGNIVTAVKKINSQNVLSQMTSCTPLMDHIPNTNAKKQLKAKQKATYSGVKSPRKKGAKNKLDLCSGSVDESCSSASVTVQANNSAFCGENKMPETSKVVRKNLNSTCVMKTENVDMHVEMSFEEDDCDKQSHMENVKDLLAFTNVQEPINCLSKNEAQSKIDSLPLLPFIKTEPIFNSECVAENTNIPDHSNDVKSTSDTLDKSHEVQKQNFTVENNAAISTKPSLKRRKRVRKGGGKKKSKAAKLDRQTNNDDKITSNENCADASVSFASELPNNNAPIVSENGNETLEKDDAIINRNICKQNNDSISTLTEDRVHSFIDEEPISTSSMNTIIEDVETKSNKNQKKKKRNRKKTSWYPKKRKSTPKKKPVGEESSELGLTEIPGEKAQTGIAAENFETPSFSENNIQSKESKESNLKQAVNNVSQVLEKSQKAVSILKPQEHLQNNALSLNPKHINASKATTQEAEQVITSSSVNSTCKANNSTELSTGSDRSQVSENSMPLRSVSIDEFRQTLSSIKKEKDDSPKTANCNENVSNSASSQLNSQNDVVKDLSKSSDNDTAHSSLSLINRLQSIKTEKPDKTIMQCMDNISGKAAETATATFVTNELNIGLAKNLNLSESTTSHKINQKEGGDTGLNHLIHKHDAKSTKVDKFPPKSNNSENIGQNIPYTEKNTPSTSIPISQDSALLKNLSLDTNLLEKSDFIKVLQSIKKEKVDEEKTSKIPVNNKLISCEAKPGSVLDKTESDLEKTVQCSSLKSSSHDKILCSIKKEISEAVVQSCSNSENMSKHFPEATNASNSLKHTLSSDKEMLTQDKELNSNCRETLTAKAFLEKQNLTDSQSKSSQNNQYNNNISVSSIQVKKENDRINAKATTVPMFSDLQCDHNSLSREETYNRCSSVTAEKSLPLPSENDTAIKYMKQALNGNSMLNTPESFPQFHNHLMSRSQNFTSNLHQSNEQVSFVHNNNTYSAVNEVAGIPKFNTPLILNDCSPSSQYKNVFDDSDYASDYSTPVVPYSNEPIHNPVQPVSAKCSNEFFKYPHPAEINLTKSKPKFRNKSKIYSRVETASMSLSLKEISERMEYFEKYGTKSISKLGDIARVTYYPLCKHEIECYHRIHNYAPSQKLLSLCNRSKSPLVQMTATNAFEFQNLAKLNDYQVPNKISSAYSEFNGMEMSFQEKKESHKMISDSQLEDKAFTQEANIVNPGISPLYNSYLPTKYINDTSHSVHPSGSLNSKFLGTDPAVDSKAWQDIFKAVQTLNSLQHTPFETKHLSKSVEAWKEKSEKFHSNVDEKIIPYVGIGSQPVSSNTYIESGEENRTRHEHDFKTVSNERNDSNFSNIHNIQFLFRQMADSLESRNAAQNVYQQNNTLHAVSEEKKLELEPYPTESYEWRPMDNSLPTIEQTKNIQEATVLGPNEDNQEIAKNESSVYVDKSNLIDISIQSAVPNVNVTELQKILELAANIGDGNQKPKEMQMYRNDQVQTEGKQGFSTSVETPFPCDITTTTTKGEENSELNSVSIACDNEQPSDVPNGSEKSKICPVSEILKNKSSINDLSNFSSHTMSDSDDEPVDNDMLVGNESCHSNVDESDTETFDNLKEDIGKQKENRNADERASTPIPQYKSKWEKIMERKALEADSKEKNKVNEHLLKDCFPVSAKISKNKKTVDLNSDLSAISEKKKKHKKSKHESKKHKSSKESKKSRSAKLKKPTEVPTPESNTKSNVSIVKTSDMKDLKKSNTSKLTENPKIYKLQKTTKKKTAIGHEKQDEQSKLSVTKHSSKEVKQKCKNKSIDDGSELFKPDPVVLKTDETNSSRRFYGKRITNRGSFLTESSDKPSKAKPVVIKKTVAKSKSVPSVRTEEYHSIIESPDVNIHSFSLMQNSKRSVISDYRNISPTCSNRPVINDYRNISPSFSNRQNMTLNPTNSFTSFDKYAYEKSQVNGFEDFRCLSPQDSLDSLPSVLKLAHDKNEKPQSQNNLRTENYLAEESFSSLSSQNSHQAPTLHSKEFEMLSNLMNFNKKPLNQSSPVFETFTFAPTSSLGNSSPFDDDSKNLMSPLFSETLNVRQSNSQSVRLNSGKCICLPPRDLKLKVGHTIIDSLNVLLLILEWNVDWLFQQKNTLDPPPISKTLHKASDKYESYEEYYNTLLPLMLLETWQRIYVSWTHLQQAHPYFCEILSYCEESSYITVECQTAYNAHDHDKSLFPEEGNIIMVKFTTKTKGVIKILGYVTSVKIRPFNAATDTKNFSNKNLKNIRDDQIHMLKLTFMGAYASDDFDRKQPIRVQVLCNIKSTLKQNDALLFVDKSPLHRNILNPLDSGLSTVTLPPRNILKEPDRVNECLKEIIKGIVSPHPIPLLTVIKLLPSSDRLLVLPHLITKMKKSYRTKVLLCTRTAKALGDVGLSLVKHQLNVVVVGKRADTHVGLRKYLLDDLAVGEINKNTDAEESLLKGNLQKEHIKPDLLIKAKQIVLTECDVILCNIRNSHDDLMAQTFYDNECIAHMCCIVDEANLCTEPETLIPLMNGISKLILIGDPDVPAKVCSKTAINLDYKRSLFHRAYDLDLISD